MRINTDNLTVSIIIEKVLDRIKVSIMGITSHQELHEIMKKINFIMGIYYEKKIQKNKQIHKFLV